jgi:hypothetical protein
VLINSLHNAPVVDLATRPRVAFVAGSLLTLVLSAAVFAVNEMIVAEHMTRLEAAASELFG